MLERHDDGWVEAGWVEERWVGAARGTRIRLGRALQERYDGTSLEKAGRGRLHRRSGLLEREKSDSWQGRCSEVYIEETSRGVEGNFEITSEE